MSKPRRISFEGSASGFGGYDAFKLKLLEHRFVRSSEDARAGCGSTSVSPRARTPARIEALTDRKVEARRAAPPPLRTRDRVPASWELGAIDSAAKSTPDGRGARSRSWGRKAGDV
jgi:hypothetical protein